MKLQNNYASKALDNLMQLKVRFVLSCEPVTENDFCIVQGIYEIKQHFIDLFFETQVHIARGKKDYQKDSYNIRLEGNPGTIFFL